MSDERQRARERALRAARAITLGLAATSVATGCALSHRRGDDVRPDGGRVLDAGPPDSGPIADAGTCPPWDYANPPRTQHCCETEGFYWDGTHCIVAVPGPFVPPALDA